MTDWCYDGCVKVHSDDGRRTVEHWVWRCAICGYKVGRPFGNHNRPSEECPICVAQRKNSRKQSILMEEKTALVLDWLHEIIDNPEDWREYYSDSETKTLAEYAMGIIRCTETTQ